MEFFNSTINTVRTIVSAVGAIFMVYGVIELAKSRRDGNAGGNSHGWEIIICGAAITFTGITLVPQLATLFN